MNDRITSREVRVIDAEGEQRGVMTRDDAIRLAQESNCDLVEVSPNASPPVCRVMDYGKFKYEQNKRLQQAKKNQQQTQVKEIKFRPRTEDGDYQVKLRNLTRFLENGDKAKVTLRFRGREIVHRELGFELLTRVEKDLAEISVVEQRPKMEGRQMVMVLGPKKKK